MKDRFLLLAAVAFICTLAFAATSSAQTATFSYNDGNGVPNAGSYSPGSSFTFSINLAFTSGGSIANVVGLSYWFEQQNPGAPFYFAITNRDATGSQFTSLQTPGITYPQSFTPQSSSDLGGARPSGTGVGTGNYFVANLTISIAPSALPGTYLIENTTSPAGKRSVISDDQGHTLAIPQAIYTITVVPEPASVALLGMGLAGLIAIGARSRLAPGK